MVTSSRLKECLPTRLSEGTVVARWVHAAVAEAARVIDAARVTAAAMTGEDGVGGGGAPERGGVSVVNLMGRHAGFLAAHATLAARDVDACLVPEVPFFLEVRGRPFVVCFRFRFRV